MGEGVGQMDEEDSVDCATLRIGRSNPLHLQGEAVPGHCSPGQNSSLRAGKNCKIQ
jgi:hypothetical protein